MINKVILVGNVGANPEVRTLNGGESTVKTATLRIATSERFRDRNGGIVEKTEWHNVVFWRRHADFVEKYAAKGVLVYVEGKLRTRQWTDQSGSKRYTTEVVADDIRLLGKKAEGAAARQQDAPEQAAPVAPEDLGFMPSPDTFDDMPE